MKYKLIAEPNEGITSPVAQVLLNRGISQAEIPQFLYPSDECIISAYKLDNIELAAKTILAALILQQDIYIQVDSDCDGYTSAAILINYLYQIAPSTVENHIIYNLHDSKHHGLNFDNIPAGVGLVIAPDSSSNEPAIHKRIAEEIGAKVVVIDHHDVDTIDPDDPAILVNNQTCRYPNKSLSGAGVVYKVCKVLDQLVKCNYADNYLDLASLGMIADMMDIRSMETHRLILQGCQHINNIFYKELIARQEFSMKGEVNSFTVGWYIAPYINAMTRSGTDAEKLCLFESMLDYKAVRLVPSTKRGEKGKEEKLVTQAIRTCMNVKKHQEDNKKKALDMILPMIDPNSKEPMIIIQLENPVDTNLTGLLANQIMGQFNKPTLVLNKITNEDGSVLWAGSCRGYATEEVEDWRLFILNSGFAEYSAGHPFAFGACFTPANLEQFRSYVSETFPDGIESCQPVDFIWLDTDDFDHNVLLLGQAKGIWGQDVAEPYVILKRIPIKREDIALLGKGTLRINLKNHKTSCIKFNAEKMYNELMDRFTTDDLTLNLTILGKCDINEYLGNVTPQIKMENYDVEAVRKWYF